MTASFRLHLHMLAPTMAHARARGLPTHFVGSPSWIAEEPPGGSWNLLTLPSGVRNKGVAGALRGAPRMGQLRVPEACRAMRQTPIPRFAAGQVADGDDGSGSDDDGLIA